MFRSSSQASPAPVFRRTTRPTQGELSLDAVKVVRNDLSDSDLEVVAAAPKKAAAHRPVPDAETQPQLHALSKQ
jgi:hypothetical protein